MDQWTSGLEVNVNVNDVAGLADLGKALGNDNKQASLRTPS